MRVETGLGETRTRTRRDGHAALVDAAAHQADSDADGAGELVEAASDNLGRGKTTDDIDDGIRVGKRVVVVVDRPTEMLKDEGQSCIGTSVPAIQGCPLHTHSG